MYMHIHNMHQPRVHVSLTVLDNNSPVVSIVSQPRKTIMITPRISRRESPISQLEHNLYAEQSSQIVAYLPF